MHKEHPEKLLIEAIQTAGLTRLPWNKRFHVNINTTTNTDTDISISNPLKGIVN